MKLFESGVDATPRSIAVDGRLSLSDRLFAALDTIRIEGPSGGWITEVLGIHTIHGERWVQIVARGNSRCSVLLRLSGAVTADDTIRTLRWWSLQPVASRSALVTVVGERSTI
jgi:hypothetical protein